MDRDLSILFVEADKDKALGIIDALSEAGFTRVKALGNISGLARAVEEHTPDIVLIDLAHPDRDTLEHVTLASGAATRAVALFVDRTDPDLTQAALSAGVSAYVVDGLQPGRIKPVLETAITRFQITKQMQNELEAAKQALEDRKTLDRAKGIIMRQRGMSEDEAYQLLRKTAMDQGRKVTQVAQALVTAAELLG